MPHEVASGTPCRLSDDAERQEPAGVQEAVHGVVAGGLRGISGDRGREVGAGAVEVVMNCKKCDGKMIKSQAIGRTWTGLPDFIGGSVVTVSPGGPGRLIQCLKCAECGWSVSTDNA